MFFSRYFKCMFTAMVQGAAWLMVLVLIHGCAAWKPSVEQVAVDRISISTQETKKEASPGSIVPSARFSDVQDAAVLLDNDQAFLEKLHIIRNARQTLDLAYYIYADDYSSSLFSQELVLAAQRGVRVRLLVDYHTNYPRLDLFRMLEHVGNTGQGSFEVRFFNRPSNVIIKDAVYMTLGCGDVGSAGDFGNCSKAKLQAVDARLQEAMKEEPDHWIPTNYNSGISGLFLSALYAKDMELLAFSVLHGQDIQFSKGADGAARQPASRQEKEKKLRSALKAAKVYWQSRGTNERVLERTAARLKLSMAFMIYGKELRPLYDALTAYLPIGQRSDAAEAIRDWDYLTEFLHHKLLMADDRHVVLGGRNVEDSYHMHRDPLVEKYIFMDTDIRLNLATASSEMRRSFDRLWDFRVMTASLEDVLRHAPNDYLVATQRSRKECFESVAPQEASSPGACRERVFSRYYYPDIRIAEQEQWMNARAEIFQAQYQPRRAEDANSALPLDAGTRTTYLENLPFMDQPSQSGRLQRSYGSKNGSENEYGKHLHHAWLEGLAQACRDSAAGKPLEVILHSAYFFPPSNLLRQLGEMVDGTQDCRNVSITVLTNSPETTDLGIINLAARYSLKAFGDHYSKHRHPKKGATFSYYEYLPQRDETGKSQYSLHSKVSILGRRAIIGSANADVRSYMMDTNNGLLMEGAPLFIENYITRVHEILSNPAQTVNRTEDMASRSVEELLASDREFTRRLVQKLAGDGLKDKLPDAPLVEFLESALKGIHSLSRDFLNHSSPESASGDRFNSYFKLL